MRKLKGKIVSDKMEKTAVVEVQTWKKHSRYLKYLKTTKRFKAHNENNEYKTGDEVIIQETKPFSKEKKWKIIGLDKKSEQKSE